MERKSRLLTPITSAVILSAGALGFIPECNANSSGVDLHVRPGIKATPEIATPALKPTVSKSLSQEAEDILRGSMVMPQGTPLTSTGWVRFRIEQEVGFLKKVVPWDVAKIQGDELTIGSGKYDLNTREGRVFGEALLEANIVSRFPDWYFPFRSVTPAQMQTLEQMAKKVSIHEDSTRLLSQAWDLAITSRLIDAFGGTGKSRPQSILLSGLEQDKGKDVLTLEARGPYESAAVYYSKQDPDLLRNYILAIEKAYRSRNQELKDPYLAQTQDFFTKIDDYSEFINTLRDYMLDGASFRERIRYAQMKGFATEAEILQAKYDTIKDWAGVEFSSQGLVKKLDPVRPGQILSINDYPAVDDLPRKGVFLRPKPVDEIDPNWFAVYHDRVIRVVAGPIEVIRDGYPKGGMRMWQIETGEAAVGGRAWVPDRNQGWVSEEYLQNPR